MDDATAIDDARREAAEDGARTPALLETVMSKASFGFAFVAGTTAPSW